MTKKITDDNRAIILGIETSCDETAVAIVDQSGHVLAHQLLSQIKAHQAYGGVVPEIAARQHISHLDGLIKAALDEADMTLHDMTAIAATTGPGLVGGLMVGVMTARAMAAATGLPFIPVNHLEAHALMVRMTDPVAFPYLLLLVSGGHCQLLAVNGPGDYRRLGTTIDDAVGEAFDKTAKLLGLGYPGGPQVENAAASGDSQRFALPRPMKGKPGADFSFSGLKTAVRRQAEQLVKDKGGLAVEDRADLCAAFQAAIADCLTDRMRNAVVFFEESAGPASEQQSPTIVVAGGVAANQLLRTELTDCASDLGYGFVAPPPALCTDNGVMIAWAGMEHWLKDKAKTTIAEGPQVPRPRWPLDQTAEPRVGSGKKGTKA